MSSRVEGDFYWPGAHRFANVTLPAGSVDDNAVAAGADIAATKTVARRSASYAQADGSAVVAATQGLHIVRGATGTLVGFEAVITGTAATGGDRTVVIDLQKSTGAGAFATVLSSTITFNNSSIVRTISAATLSSTALVDGDLLRIVVTVSGAAGNQAFGLLCVLTYDEKPS